MDKKDLTEEDIKAVYITPALEKAGWKTPPYRLMEHYFTDGRVIAQGSMHARQKGKKADYLLSIAQNRPIAIVEAKDKVSKFILYTEQSIRGKKNRPCIRLGTILYAWHGAHFHLNRIYCKDEGF